MSIIEQILNRIEIKTKPPVLIDIGASGQIHKIWEKIAAHSICIAFDADDREFNFVTKETSGYKKLHIFNCIVSDKDDQEIDFYLTKSPFCSSTLKPDNNALNAWAFADKFEIEKKVKLKSISLKKTLEQVGIDYVDWFKTDSQGTDLRLFQNLGENIFTKILVAEFEPGIIDAYEGEDKFYHLLKFFSDKNFWVSDLKIKGSQRIYNKDLENISKNNLYKKLIQHSHKISPGWSECSFINSFNDVFTTREYLLGWLFSTLNKQHGFAYYLAQKAGSIFDDPFFFSLKNFSVSRIKRNVYQLKFLNSFLEKVLKKLGLI
jgi:FkbM family methyltransferase